LKFTGDEAQEVDTGREVVNRKLFSLWQRFRRAGRVLALSLPLVAPVGVPAERVRACAFYGARAHAQPGKITDPKVAAARLYNAWRGRNRVAALKVAERETVDKLFGVRWRAMRSEGCERRDEGGFRCIYRDAKSDLSLSINVAGGASAGYAVESVSFSTGE